VFHLEKLETVTLNDRRVLHAQGYFQDESLKPIRYFDGIYFDATPQSAEMRVYEVFLQAPTVELFLEHVPAFSRSLFSITWKSRV
jgi:hypothetical protein